MLELYWACFIGGLLFTVLTLLFGDLLSAAFHLPLLEPLPLIGSITVLGGSGILLTEYTALSPIPVLTLATLLACTLALCSFFFYIRPMKNAETSTAFSIHDLQGRIAEVLTPIPTAGYGEVTMKIATSTTHQIAASYTGDAIPTGTRVVVVEIREDTLYVAPFE